MCWFMCSVLSHTIYAEVYYTNQVFELLGDAGFEPENSWLKAVL